MDHFKYLNQDDQDSDFSNITADRVTHLNTDQNKVITESEIRKAILHLKNSKGRASDMILNEFLKAFLSLLMPVPIHLLTQFYILVRRPKNDQMGSLFQFMKIRVMLIIPIIILGLLY